MQCPRVVLNLPASLFAILGNVPRGILSTPRSAIANHTSLMFSRLVNSHSAASQGICHRGPVCLSVRFLAQHETTGNNYMPENMGHPADSFCLVSAGFVPSLRTECTHFGGVVIGTKLSTTVYSSCMIRSTALCSSFLICSCESS